MTQTGTHREALLFLCVISVLTAAVLRAQPLQSANDRSRWCTVWSLVEQGTYQIDDIDRRTRFSTIDKVRHRSSDNEPWHFYSSKPPLLSTMVAGLYWIERRTLGLDLFAHTAHVTRLLLLFVNLLPMCLALNSLMRSLRFLGVSELSRLFVLAVAGFGSMLNPYLTTLNNHTPAAICVVFCISSMIRLEAARLGDSRRQARSLDFAQFGLCAAFAACFELPSALFGVLAFLLAMRVSTRQTWKWFVPAALLPLTAFFVTNWICTGSLRPFYTWYGTEKYEYVHEGVPSYWMSPKGLDANDEPWPVYLFHCVLGHHGLLSLSPVLLLSLIGWFGSGRLAVSTILSGGGNSRSDSSAEPSEPGLVPRLSTVIVTGAVLTFVTLLFYLTRTENYNYGGNSVALRWMLWISPFWWYTMLPVLERSAGTEWKLRVCGLLLAASIMSASWSQDRPWRPSWLYEWLEYRGLIEYR